MKPAPFEYVAPRDIEETLALLARHGGDAKLLAGGQSLVPMMNLRLARPAVVLNLNRVSGLGGIQAEDRGLTLGALVRQRQLERDARIAERAPLLAEAAPSIGHLQTRTRGTVGGAWLMPTPRPSCRPA